MPSAGFRARVFCLVIGAVQAYSVRSQKFEATPCNGYFGWVLQLAYVSFLVRAQFGRSPDRKAAVTTCKRGPEAGTGSTGARRIRVCGIGCAVWLGAD